jgi:hypothetical protein
LQRRIRPQNSHLQSSQQPPAFARTRAKSRSTVDVDDCVASGYNIQILDAAGSHSNPRHHDVLMTPTMTMIAPMDGSSNNYMGQQSPTFIMEEETTAGKVCVMEEEAPSDQGKQGRFWFPDRKMFFGSLG